MNKKRIILLFVTVLLGATAVWHHRHRLVEQPHDQPQTEPETIVTVIEELAPIESAPTPSPEPSVQENHKTIMVKNSITDKMLSYKKGFMSYIPEFKIVVNDIPLAREEQQSIEIPDKKLKVTYSYDFVNGYRTGTKTVIFSVPEGLSALDITFDWKNDWRVVVDGAEPLEIIE